MLSTPEPVIFIPTVGLGTRMATTMPGINKALVPVDGTPLISHIINSFPMEAKFVIALGHLGNQVRDLCNVLHGDRSIEYVQVDDYSSSAAGTATTMVACSEHLQGPFWYVACDTYIGRDLPLALPETTYFVKDVDPSSSHEYTMMKVHDGKVTDITYKTNVQAAGWSAFTGLMYIQDGRGFISRILDSGSKEFPTCLPTSAVAETLSSWVDMGNPQQYIEAVRRTQPFDFSKKGEITWTTTNKVIKWSADLIITKKRYDRALDAPSDVLPSNITGGRFLSYDMVPGTTMYYRQDPDVLARFLDWCKACVWEPRAMDADKSRKVYTTFYEEKTKQRIDQYLHHNHRFRSVRAVDSIGVLSIERYLQKIDWKMLANDARNAWIHGDMQFDNIVVTPDTRFRLIDWRSDFAGQMVGDVHYDMAKLIAGTMIDYTSIKNNRFGLSTLKDDCVVVHVTGSTIAGASDMIYTTAKSMELNLDKIRLLVPLIFLNMAPLHDKPFSDLLWCMGLRELAKLKL